LGIRKKFTKGEKGGPLLKVERGRMERGEQEGRFRNKKQGIQRKGQFAQKKNRGEHRSIIERGSSVERRVLKKDKKVLSRNAARPWGSTKGKASTSLVRTRD